jgi:hypothetical protein
MQPVLSEVEGLGMTKKQIHTSLLRSAFDVEASPPWTCLVGDFYAA